MWFVYFDVVCGEGTTAVGIFENVSTAASEYKATEKMLKNSYSGNEVGILTYINVTVGEPFKWENTERLLVDVVPGKQYKIDLCPSKTLNEKEDKLLVNLSSPRKAEFVYLVKNRFVCEEESRNYPVSESFESNGYSSEDVTLSSE